MYGRRLTNAQTLHFRQLRTYSAAVAVAFENALPQAVELLRILALE